MTPRQVRIEYPGARDACQLQRRAARPDASATTRQPLRRLPCTLKPAMQGRGLSPFLVFG